MHLNRIYALAKEFFFMYNKHRTCRCDGIGRRDGLKIRWWRHRAGSSPATGTTELPTVYRSGVLFFGTRNIFLE